MKISGSRSISVVNKLALNRVNTSKLNSEEMDTLDDMCRLYNRNYVSIKFQDPFISHEEANKLAIKELSEQVARAWLDEYKKAGIRKKIGMLGSLTILCALGGIANVVKACKKAMDKVFS